MAIEASALRAAIEKTRGLGGVSESLAEFDSISRVNAFFDEWAALKADPISDLMASMELDFNENIRSLEETVAAISGPSVDAAMFATSSAVLEDALETHEAATNPFGVNGSFRDFVDSLTSLSTVGAANWITSAAGELSDLEEIDYHVMPFGPELQSSLDYLIESDDLLVRDASKVVEVSNDVDKLNPSSTADLLLALAAVVLTMSLVTRSLAIPYPGHASELSTLSGELFQAAVTLFAAGCTMKSQA